MKPFRVIHLILDKTNGLKFLNYWFLNLLNPQLKSMKARIEKSKTKFKKKKRIEKPFFYFFPKTFTFDARLTPTKWLAFCKICFIHVGLLSNSSFELFPWSMMCTNVYVPGFIVNYIHVFCMETTINLLTSSSDQCLAIAFQNQMKILSNKLKHFIDIVNPLLTPPPPIHIYEDPLPFKHPPLPFPLILHNQSKKW